MAENINL